MLVQCKPNFFWGWGWGEGGGGGGGGHVSNFYIKTEPCKRFRFLFKLDPQHDQNLLEHDFKNCQLYTLIASDVMIIADFRLAVVINKTIRIIQCPVIYQKSMTLIVFLLY